jgi:hypothetical protein
MAHNGGRSQLNFWFLNSAKETIFLNHLKAVDNWTKVSDGTSPTPSELTDRGYPKEAAGTVYTIVYIPNQTDRPGNWCIRWTGTASNTLGTSFTNVSGVGTGTGTNGKLVFTPTNSPDSPDGALAITYRLTGTNDSDPITNVEFYHEDDEALLDAGEYFTTQYITKFEEANWGVYRLLDHQEANRNTCTTWDTRKSVNHFSWFARELRESIYSGATTNVGDDYSVTPYSGFVLADKAQMIVRFNANASTTTCTLDSGGGAIPIMGASGASLDTSQKPVINRLALLTYDAALNVWVKFGADAVYPIGGIHSGVPVEICVALCNKLNAHPWLHVPYLALDPLTDFAAELATYCLNNLNDGLVPRFEPANEVWNSAAGFEVTPYAAAKANAAWGSSNDWHNWYGRALSRMGEAISAVYGDDRSRYQVICGVQTSSTPANSNARLASTRYVSDGGDPASDWATHVAITNYWSSIYYNTATETTLATDYAAAGTDAEREAIADEYLQVSATFFTSYYNTFSGWKTWGVSFGVDGLCAYEGGYSPDYTSNTNKDTLRRASKFLAKIEGFTTSMYEAFENAGGEFPSCYMLTGNAAWSIFDYNIYDTPSPQWDAIVAWNAVTVDPEPTTDTGIGGSWSKPGKGRKKKQFKYGHEVVQEEREAAQQAYLASRAEVVEGSAERIQRGQELLGRTLTDEQAEELVEALQEGDDTAIALILAVAATIH